MKKRNALTCINHRYQEGRKLGSRIKDSFQFGLPSTLEFGKFDCSRIFSFQITAITKIAQELAAALNLQSGLVAELQVEFKWHKTRTMTQVSIDIGYSISLSL
jgi:hypothetical protein